MRHLFVCTNALASGKPACGRRGGPELLAAVQNELLTRGESARVTACGCLGTCFDGPNAVIYPDAIWYGRLTVADANALADHLVAGAVHDAKQLPAPGEDNSPP